MPYELLNPLCIYPIGEVAAGTVMQKHEFPLGMNIEAHVKAGNLRPTAGEEVELAPTDVEGWKLRSEKLEAELKELKTSKPDKGAVSKLAQLEDEHASLTEAHDTLRASHAATEAELSATVIDRNEARTELGQLKGTHWEPPVKTLEPSKVGVGPDASPVMKQAEPAKTSASAASSKPHDPEPPKRVRRTAAQMAQDAADLRTGADAAVGAAKAAEDAKTPLAKTSDGEAKTPPVLD